MGVLNKTKVSDGKDTTRTDEHVAKKHQTNTSAGPKTPSVPNEKITETAKLLLYQHDSEADDDDASIADQDDEAAVLDDSEALAKIHFAATQRKDLDRSHLKEARIVEPVYGKEDMHAVPVNEEISQKDMMWRMMRALNRNDEEEGGNGTAALEKKIRRLHSNGKRALSVPLPAPVQGRLDRATAYDSTKEEVGKKWGKIVQKNRKAKQLVFPLNGPGKETGGFTTFIAGNFKPSADYEEEVESLLREAGVSTDQDVLKQEDGVAQGLNIAPVSKEEVIKRRRELAKIRSLMFHYEHKMKRIKKIKSKKYRRHLKKEKEKLVETMGDSDDEETRARRAEQRRVEERMTLRHKNTSKWVRRQLQRKEGSRNPATKAAIEEQLQLHEELRRRQGIGTENSETSDEEGSTTSAENGTDGAEEALRKELTRDRRNPKRKGVLGMRFMQEASERKRKEALSLLEEMNRGETENEDDDETVAPSAGRRSFRREQSKKKVSTKENVREGANNNVDTISADPSINSPPAASDPNGGNNAATEDLSANVKASIGFGFTTKVDGRLSADANPWLNGFGQENDQNCHSKAQGRTDLAGSEKHGSSAEADSIRATVSQKSSFAGIASTATPLHERGEPQVDQKLQEKTQNSSRKRARPEDSIQAEDRKLAQPDEELLRMQDISQAFAGVGGAEQAEFDAAKQSEVERGMPTAKSLQAEVLPGWGSWDGAGMPKMKRRKAETPFAKAARERLEAARASAAGKRSDRTMRHVILNEKRIKQATDLTLSSIPFPFTSREQWEREVDTTVCREQVSTAAFKHAVRKRVVAKPGTVIEPIRQSELSGKSAHVGKRGIIDLRKKRSEKRSKARRGLMT